LADRWSGTAAVLRPVLWIDARRPAAWISGVTAVVAGAWLAFGEGSGPLLAAAIAAGGLLGVAAIGRLPVAAPSGSRQPWRLPLVTRAAWPAVGLLLGAAGMSWSGGIAGQLRSGLAAATCAAIGLVAAAVVRPPRTEATVASLLLGMTAAAAAAATTIWAGGGGATLQALGGLLVGGLVAAALVLDQGSDVRDWLGPMASRRSIPEAGPLVAMIASLAAMVGWYFLAPQYAWAYAVLATGLFVCLAVPPATETTPATARFLRSSPGRPPLPGSLSRAARITAVYLGILGWPALVAFALPAAAGERVAGPLTAVLWLASAGGCLLALAAAAARTGGGETARAAALAIAALAAFAAAKQDAMAPRLPSLPRGAVGTVRDANGSGVEPREGSCKTPRAAQPSTPARGVVENRAVVAR
jgi:hypothetical protein